MTQAQYTIKSKSRSASHCTKILRKVIQQEDQPQAEESYVPDWASQLEQLDAEIAAMEHSGVIRPPWAPGLTNAELLAIAAHENLNPYRYDWWDGADSLIIRQAKSGGFKRNVRNTLTELRAKRTQLKRELSWA
jgi:hypothetical protein